MSQADRQPLPILYQDAHLVAVHKPAGMLVHRTQMAKGVNDVLLQRLRGQLGRRLYPFHRLDRPTSGVVVFALDSATAARMTQAMQARLVTKKYLAVVRGFMDEAGVIDYPVRAVKGEPAKPALSHYRLIAREVFDVPSPRYPQTRVSWVEVIPKSGRRHQIRRHLVHLRHPIAGDRVHGDGAFNRTFSQMFGVPRLLLAALSFACRHPWTGRPLEIQTQPEPEFNAGWLQRRLSVSR